MSDARAHPACAPISHRDCDEGSILVLETDTSIGANLVEQLRADGYGAKHARTAEHARALARMEPVRLLAIGELDERRAVPQLLAEIRDTAERDAPWAAHLPVIVISPDAGELALLRAFEHGADDFIAHPARYLELRARLRAILRRVERSAEPAILRVGSLHIDTRAHMARIGSAPVALCRLEYDLLVHLARDPMRVFTKRDLLLAVWGAHPRAGTRTVDSHASRLRRKLHAAGADGLVVNVWGVGYRLL